MSLGPIGIEGNDVYTISYKDLCAIVHNCPAEPYASDDDELVKEWIKAHQSVLDEAKRRFSVIVPMGFDMVLRPKDASSSPEQTVREWLKDEHDRLIALIEKVRGKDEYGVQIFYDPEIMRLATSKSEELQKIRGEMASKPPGVAYMYKQKLENMAKAEAERLVDGYFRDFYEKIRCHCDDMVLEKNKKTGSGKVMLLNLSCLVSQDEVNALGEELEKINAMEGFSVRFTGPWPPYSFVSESKKEEGSKT